MPEQYVLRDEVITAIERGLAYYELDASKAKAVYVELTGRERGQIRVLIRNPGYQVHEIGAIAAEAYHHL